MRTLIVGVLLLGWSGLALAHVTVDPRKAPAGSYAKLTFRVPHGCEGSATTKITLQIPEGVVSVKPQVNPGWKIQTKIAKLATPFMSHGKEITETVAEVSWTGGPLPDAYMDEFGLSVKLPDRPEARLVFPVVQKCQKGSTSWTEVPSADKDAPAVHFPAPILTLTPAN